MGVHVFWLCLATFRLLRDPNAQRNLECSTVGDGPIQPSMPWSSLLSTAALLRVLASIAEMIPLSKAFHEPLRACRPTRAATSPSKPTTGSACRLRWPAVFLAQQGHVAQDAWRPRNPSLFPCAASKICCLYERQKLQSLLEAATFLAQTVPL